MCGGLASALGQPSLGSFNQAALSGTPRLALAEPASDPRRLDPLAGGYAEWRVRRSLSGQTATRESPNKFARARPSCRPLALLWQQPRDSTSSSLETQDRLACRWNWRQNCGRRRRLFSKLLGLEQLES